MPPPSATERNRIKAFVEQTGNHAPGSPQKNRRGNQTPDTAFTENLESLDIIQANSQYEKAHDDVFDENTRPASAQSVDRRPGHLDHLFTGSELSEAFMRSGRSTPTSEYNRRVPVKYVSKAPHKQETKKTSRFTHAAAHSLPAVTVGSDLRMTVADQPKRSNFAEMKDGFSAAGLTHSSARHAQSPVRNSQRLQQPHHHHNHHHHNNTQQKKSLKREPLMPAPQVEEENRSRTQSRARFEATPPAFTDSDVASQSSHGKDDLQTTPRGKQLPTRNRVHYAHSPVKQLDDRKRRRKSLDYDDQALNIMEYKELLEQPFDFDPATAMATGKHTGHHSDSSQRLAQMQHMGMAEQQRFFADMPVDEWESAGHWFSEQFTGIMRRLTAARQSKRQIVESFELEAAAREAEVRRRSDKIDEKLQKMREDGMKVVGGRS
ncbi:hypothetical protein ARSEF4850_007788 [Beauveria asiatica]